MIDPFIFVCPECGSRNATREEPGKRVLKCKKCKKQYMLDMEWKEVHDA
jgi:DNA-directed RNA polymerase subunit M/transcription elongation factor TFIIS